MRGRRAARSTAPSSTLPRPLIRTPPAPSSVTERKRPVCAARSSLARAASSRRSVRSGSTISARCRAVRASSVALSRRASSSSACSPLARRSGLEGRVSTASQMIPAWAGDASPRRRASRVAGCSLTSCWAWITARRPSRRVRPARCVNQSVVDPQCRLLRARSRRSASARSRASSADSCPFRDWTTAKPSTSSSSENPVASRSSSDPTWTRACSSTTAGEAAESTAGSGSRHRCPGTHPPGLPMTSMPARHLMTSPGSTTRGTTASVRPDDRVLHSFEHMFESMSTVSAHFLARVSGLIRTTVSMSAGRKQQAEGSPC